MRTNTMNGHTIMARSSERSKDKAEAILGPYARFGAMIGTSAIFMYAFMYLNSYELDHVRWSTTRFYMTLIMTATMAVVMLTYMRAMYKNKIANIAIYAVSAVVFVTALYFVRSQTFIHDQSWMRAMIPHHSIAVLTSRRAAIEDFRVKALATKIIESQEREIKEMDWLIEDISKHGKVKSSIEAAVRPVPSF